MGSIFIAESLVIGKGYLSHNSWLLNCIVTNLVSSLCINISNLFEGYLQCSALREGKILITKILFHPKKEMFFQKAKIWELMRNNSYQK